MEETEVMEEGRAVEAGGVEFENGSTVGDETAEELSGGKEDGHDAQ